MGDRRRTIRRHDVRSAKQPPYPTTCGNWAPRAGPHRLYVEKVEPGTRSFNGNLAAEHSPGLAPGQDIERPNATAIDMQLESAPAGQEYSGHSVAGAMGHLIDHLHTISDIVKPDEYRQVKWNVTDRL